MVVDVVRGLSCVLLIKDMSPTVQLYYGSPQSPDTITLVMSFNMNLGSHSIRTAALYKLAVAASMPA